MCGLSVLVLWPLCRVWLACIGSVYRREPSLQIGGLSVLCGLFVLVLCTKKAFPSRLEASGGLSVLRGCLYWCYIQKRTFRPDWKPLCFVCLVCIGSIFKKKPSLRIGSLFVLCGLPVLVLYPQENLSSRWEASLSLFCVACWIVKKLRVNQVLYRMCAETTHFIDLTKTSKTLDRGRGAEHIYIYT